jgi:AcrR family transcriptional regulator
MPPRQQRPDPEAQPTPAPAAVEAPDGGAPGDGAPGDDPSPSGEPGSVVRRAPFAANPQVGARGQRTQQRILDAALRVFGEVGYHQCGIARITEVAGCSRVSFYQYFSSKEDVFLQLAGQVARQLAASTEALDPLTPDAAGWATLRGWVARHTEIYERYEPVFDAFPAAAETDEAVAAGGARAGERNLAMIRAKVEGATLPARQLDHVIRLLLESLPLTQDTVIKLRGAAPGAYGRDRVDDAVTDVVHRSLFGLRPEVNVHPPAPEPPPALRFGPVMQDVLRQEDAAAELTAAGRRTYEALLDAGRDVFLARGYHRTRVDDVVEAAGVSHGAFYRYFEGKDQLAHVLAGRALRTVSTAVADMPELSGDEAAARTNLRRWLRSYNATHATQAALVRVWVDAALQDPALGPDSAAVLDWGRRRFAAFLEPRGFGDVDTEALVMMSLLAAFGAREQPAAVVDAAVHIVDRGLLGR